MKTPSVSWKQHGADLSPLLSGIVLLGCGAVWLPAQSVPEIVWITNAHGYGVTSVAFSGSGDSLASGSSDSTVKVWASTNTQLLRRFDNPGGAVLSVALSPDGSLVAAGDGDGKTRMWRVADGIRLWLGGPDNEFVYSLDFSPDGILLGISRSDGINLRYAETGAGIPFGEPEGEVYEIGFSPDGRLLASANANRSASLWRVPEGTLVRDFTGHSNLVNSVSFSPDGTLLATASTDGTARLWRVADGTVVRIIQGGGGVARFSADGQLLLTVNGGPINLWRVSNGQWLHTYTNATASALAVASDGKHFAYGRSDGAVVLARLPLWITEASYHDYAVTLRWQGGSGRYQVQARMSLATGAWQDLGDPTTNTESTWACVSPMFYRVQSLVSQ